MKLKKIISLFMLCVIGGASVGCSFLGGLTGESSISEIEESSSEIISSSSESVYEPEESDYKLVDGGRSAYTLVLPEESTINEDYAATEFSSFFDEATGIVLPTKKEGEVTYSADSKLIIFGDTQFTEHADVDVDAIPWQGFTIKTVDSNVFILGEDIGVLYGAYELLHQTFNYEYYFANAYILDKNVKDLNLKEHDFSDSPDIALRTPAWDQINGSKYSKRARVTDRYDIFMTRYGSAEHNTFAEWLPPDSYQAAHPDWYSDDGLQLCYTAHGNATELAEMQVTVFERMKSLIRYYYDELGDYRTAISFTHQDTATWCKCSSCAEMIDQYGSANSVTIIKFLNPIAKGLQTWMQQTYPDRETVKIAFFAYNATVSAPVKSVGDDRVPIDDSVILADNLAVYIANITQAYTYSVHEKANVSAYNTIKDWALIAKSFFIWGYDTNFRNFILWYDTMGALSDYYKALRDVGVEYMFNQGQIYSASNLTGFDSLKVYLNHKLMWDVDANVAKLTKDFFEGYYGEAAKPMLEYYESFQAWTEYLRAEKALSGSVYFEAYNKTHFPKQVLTSWMESVEKAYAAIEKLQVLDPARYTLLRDRICLEELPIRFALIEFHGSTFKGEELLKMRTSFKEDANRLGVTSLGEGTGSLQSAVYDKWGV